MLRCVKATRYLIIYIEEDRLHDCRARNTLEAIMWHGSAKSDARHSIEKFRSLSKADRDNIIFFVESI